MNGGSGWSGGLVVSGGMVEVDLDPLAAVCLDALLAEARVDPDLAGHGDFDRVGGDVARLYVEPVWLDRAGVLSWLRLLACLRRHLVRSLALESLGRDDLVCGAAELAVDSPVATAARGLVWTGVLLEELTELAASTT